MNETNYIFGPVPSRRLGRSLGVNIVPKKVCSLDCIYCEVGITNNLTLTRKPYIKTEDIIDEFTAIYNKIKNDIDVITVTGAGEPTLNSNMRDILHGLKNIVKNEKDIAILTNTTMITDDDVYDTLLEFDIVVPSLDAISTDAFNNINKPHKMININQIIKRLSEFSHEYKGKLYLEVLFVKGVNDMAVELDQLAKVIDTIHYDKLQLTTVYRPPAYKDVKPIDESEMNAIELFFENKGIKLERTYQFENDKKVRDVDNKKQILTLLNMRPVTKKEIIKLYNIKKVELDMIIDNLTSTGEIISQVFDDKVFYYHRSLKLSR